SLGPISAEEQRCDVLDDGDVLPKYEAGDSGRCSRAVWKREDREYTVQSGQSADLHVPVYGWRGLSRLFEREAGGDGDRRRWSCAGQVRRWNEDDPVEVPGALAVDDAAGLQRGRESGLQLLSQPCVSRDT